MSWSEAFSITPLGTNSVDVLLAPHNRIYAKQKGTGRLKMPMSPLLRRLGGKLCHSTLSSFQSLDPAQVRVGANWNVSTSSKLVNGLLQNGYYVVHNAFPVEYLRRLRDEMKQLRMNGQLYPNSTHILLNDAEKASDGSKPTIKTLLLEKHDILETELALEAIRDQTSVPFLRDFFEQQVIFNSLRQALPEWLALEGHMVKVQHNAGQGACFPMHFDTYGDDGKCVTAVLYLNENWEQYDGGEIILYPFPRPRVVVQPCFGQLVLFSSQQMLHRVMPAFKQRYALTTWIYHSPQPSAKAESASFYQRMGNAVDQASCKENAPFRSMITKILRSPFRRHLVKLVYEKEWVQSLQESHLQTEEFDHYMTMHKEELQVIEAATTRMLTNFRAKDGGKNSKLPQTEKELMQWMKDEDNCKFVQNLQLPWF